MKRKGIGLVLKSSVVILGTSAVEGGLQARTIGADQVVVVSGPDNDVDLWELSQGSSLTLAGSARADYVNMYRAQLNMKDATLESSNGTGVSAQYRSAVELVRSSVHDSVGVGLLLTGDLSSTPEGRSSAHVVDSRVTGALAGVAISGHGKVTAQRSTIAATDETGAGLLLTSGEALLDEGSTVEGRVAGAAIGYDGRLQAGATRLVVANHSSVTSATGAALLVSGNGDEGQLAEILVRDGATLRSGAGVALLARDGAKVALAIERAEVVGDVVVDNRSSAQISLGQSGVLKGSVQGPANLSLGRNGFWFVQGNSRIDELAFHGGGLEFARGAAEARHLRVRGNVDGTAGSVGLNVHFDPKTPNGLWADSLAVGGDVTVLRPVDLVLNLTGNPFNTDVNGDGLANPAEGVSLVRVEGAATRDAFRLSEPFVALGAFQYQLKAFSGSEVDQGGTDDEAKSAMWDYRLVSRLVCEADCEEPAAGGGGGAGGGNGRPAVAPEIASYLSAPGAVFAYADGSTSVLHERLGEIRDHAFEGGVGGELFARFNGKRQRYTSGRSFRRYGYDFDQTVEAWQFGGSLVGLDGDNGSLRAGWAFDHGRSTVVPHAVDGDSVTRLKANGASAWVTWRAGDGFWLDWVVSRQRMNGQTDSALSGRSIGRLRATSTGLSLGAGLPLYVGNAWHMEPHVLVSTQNVRIDPIKQDNGSHMRFGGGRFLTATGGLSVFRHGEVFSPFTRLDVRSTSGSGVLLAAADGASSATRFAGGRAGAEVLTTVGLTAQLSPRVQVFGDTTYRHYIGNGGFQGWSANVGLRATF